MHVCSLDGLTSSMFRASCPVPARVVIESRMVSCTSTAFQQPSHPNYSIPNSRRREITESAPRLPGWGPIRTEAGRRTSQDDDSAQYCCTLCRGSHFHWRRRCPILRQKMHGAPTTMTEHKHKHKSTPRAELKGRCCPQELFPPERLGGVRGKGGGWPGRLWIPPAYPSGRGSRQYSPGDQGGIGRGWRGRMWVASWRGTVQLRAAAE